MVITKFAEQNLFQMRVFSNTNLYIRGRISIEQYFETNLKLISKIHLTASNIGVKKFLIMKFVLPHKFCHPSCIPEHLFFQIFNVYYEKGF